MPQEQQYNDKWRQKVKLRQKKVILYDEENTRVIIFPSVTKCAKYLGTKQASLTTIIKKGQKSKGYRVEYVD